MRRCRLSSSLVKLSFLLSFFVVYVTPFAPRVRAEEGNAASVERSTLQPKLVETKELNGRQTERFEHSTLPEWGAKNPEQKDYFYVVQPQTGPAEGRPLYVVLHSAGDDGAQAVKDFGLPIIYNPPKDFYALFCDCFENRETDWWWGGRNANEPEITPELADRATAELQPVEKRVLAEIAWVVETYKIDPNRIYLCGNSMGASGTLGIGLRNGDVFAAIKANVPAGVWHAWDRLRLSEPVKPQDFELPDPPVCLDYSAPNDDWSLGHEALFAGTDARKYSYIAYWGNFGHESRDYNVAKINDLFDTFDWTEIRKNESYPVFTNASTDDACPWPERAADAPAGQRGAYFRWRNFVDEQDAFEIELRLATATELNSKIFQIPTESTADVSLRRLQRFEVAPNQTVKWTFGDKSGEAVADRDGLLTIPALTITDVPTVLKLSRNVDLLSTIPTQASEYGSHSHIYRPNEVANFPRNLDAMRETGLDWMRIDFLWDLVEPTPGEWDFSQYDAIVEAAQARGVNVLGILGYSAASGERAWEVPDRWAEYVSQTVGRYRGKVRYWEVWNEENIDSFWANPSPRDYVEFLKLTAEAARKADPETKILFGGTAGVPFGFIEECLKLGASRYFDAMNVHPYRASITGSAQIARFQNDLRKVSDLTAQYGDRKPVWITELGWADCPDEQGGWAREFLGVVLKEVGAKNGCEPPKKVAFLRDPKRCDALVGVSESQLKARLPVGVEAEFLAFDALDDLNPEATPVLVAPPSEYFPTPYADAFCRYVEKGGTLVFLFGFPCYYAMREENGVLSPADGENSAESIRERLRLDVGAWWFDSQLPKESDLTVPADSFASAFPRLDESPKADRFLGTKFLKDGDDLVPILIGKTTNDEIGEFAAPVAGLWRFNSDWRGNIAVYTLYDLDFARVSSREAVANLARAYLTALAAGVERFFTYQFQARETTTFDKEDHFGLFHADLTPKPSREAVYALSQARPRGSSAITQTTTGETFTLSWTRPDGKTGWAIWSPDGSISGELRFVGDVDAAFDFLGDPVDATKINSLSEEALYVVGPTDLSFETNAE